MLNRALALGYALAVSGCLPTQDVASRGIESPSTPSFSQTNVDVGAATLSQDTNSRMLAALDLYLTAQAAKARADVNAAAMDQMVFFERGISERAKSGEASRADLKVVRQRLNQMQSDMASDYAAAATAMAQLSDMSGGPLDHLNGISQLTADLLTEPLSAMNARAESARVVAQAQAARAGVFQSSDAYGETTDEALLAQMQKDEHRSLVALEGQLAALQRQDAQAQTRAAQAAANYEIYAQQQRDLQELVNVFEIKVRAERDAVSLKFEAAKIALKIAALRGVLVSGDAI